MMPLHGRELPSQRRSWAWSVSWSHIVGPFQFVSFCLVIHTSSSPISSPHPRVHFFSELIWMHCRWPTEEYLNSFQFLAIMSKTLIYMKVLKRRVCKYKGASAELHSEIVCGFLRNGHWHITCSHTSVYRCRCFFFLTLLTFAVEGWCC